MKIAVASRSFSGNSTLRTELSQRYGSITFNETGRTLAGQELVEFLRGHTHVIIGLEPITEAQLEHLPELKLVSKYGVGLDMLDLHALDRHQVQVGWTGGVNKRSVAELALSFALVLMRSIAQSNKSLKQGDWKPFSGGRQLTNKTVGIIGCGHVGKDFVRLLRPFDCKILVYDIQNYPDFFNEYQVTCLPLEDLLQQSDLVSVHLPLNNLTRDLLNAKRLGCMQKGAILINTARGNIVNESAVKDLLDSGWLTGAGFDVFGTEPPLNKSLIAHPLFFGTPHVGGSTIEAILKMGRTAIDNLERGQKATNLL
jgi:phosphoglycerate dehydrogenase-like enzyme